MTPKELIDAFEVLADAPDGIDRLRELVLQLAVRGKLVPQERSEGEASALLEKATQAAERLVTLKRIKRRQPIPLGTDDQPFAVPGSWVWCRIHQVAHDLGQSKPTKKFTYIDVSAIDGERGIVGNDVAVIAPKDAPSRARKLVASGCVIYSTVRPYLRNIALIDRDFSPQAIVSTAFSVLMPYDEIEARYLYYFLRAPIFVAYVEEHQKGVAYPAINDGDFQIAPVPLPPAGEQRRIVARVDELMALLDRLEAAQGSREATRQALRDAALSALRDADDAESVQFAWTRVGGQIGSLFAEPDDMPALRESILELAVRGRLVPQDFGEEPAKELLGRIASETALLISEGRIKKPKELPPIEADDVPFPVPKGWEWCRFGDTHKFTNGHAFKSQEYQEKGVGIVRMSNLQAGSITTQNMKRVPAKYFGELPDDLRVEPGDLLIGMSGSIGQPAFNRTEETFLLNQRVGKLDPILLPREYLAIFLKTIEQHYLQISFGSGIKNLSTKQIMETPFPLPPLAEQHRIVTKVDELMALCDGLEGRLRCAQDTGASFASSAVASFA